MNILNTKIKAYEAIRSIFTMVFLFASFFMFAGHPPTPQNVVITPGATSVTVSWDNCDVDVCTSGETCPNGWNSAVFVQAAAPCTGCVPSTDADFTIDGWTIPGGGDCDGINECVTLGDYVIPGLCEGTEYEITVCNQRITVPLPIMIGGPDGNICCFTTTFTTTGVPDPGGVTMWDVTRTDANPLQCGDPFFFDVVLQAQICGTTSQGDGSDFSMSIDYTSTCGAAGNLATIPSFGGCFGTVTLSGAAGLFSDCGSCDFTFTPTVTNICTGAVLSGSGFVLESIVISNVVTECDDIGSVVCGAENVCFGDDYIITLAGGASIAGPNPGFYVAQMAGPKPYLSPIATDPLFLGVVAAVPITATEVAITNFTGDCATNPIYYAVATTPDFTIPLVSPCEDVACCETNFLPPFTVEVVPTCNDCGNATLEITVTGGIADCDGTGYTVSGTYDSSIGNCQNDECTGGIENSAVAVIANVPPPVTTAMSGVPFVLTDVAGIVGLTFTDSEGCFVDVAYNWTVPRIDIEVCDVKFCLNDNTDIAAGCPNPTPIQIDCITGIIEPPVASFTLDVPSDAFPSETTWGITNSAGVTVANGGPGVGICTPGLDPNDTYEITFFDNFGDGWSCGDAPGTAVTSATVPWTYTPGDWDSGSCGSGATPNGDGSVFGPFPIGSPTKLITPIGIFSGPGVIDGADGTADFDPAAAGVGCHIISHDYTDPSTGCVLHAETQIVVCANPEDPIPVDDDVMFCSSDPVPDLKVETPMGMDPIEGFFKVNAPSDNFPGETSWDIFNSAGAIVASGAAGCSTTGPLPIGDTYTIKFNDSFGDGWSCGDAPGTNVVDQISGTVVYAYTPGAWVGTFCGDTNDANYPNGNGSCLGPFPIGSPTPPAPAPSADNWLWFGPSPTPPTVVGDGSHVGEGMCFNPAAFFPSDFCPLTFWVVAVDIVEYDDCGKPLEGGPNVETCYSCPVPIMITEYDSPDPPKVTSGFHCIGKDPSLVELTATCDPCLFCPAGPFPVSSIIWYDDMGNVIGTGPTLNPFTSGAIDPDACEPGCVTFFASCVCTSDIVCESERSPVSFEIIDCDLDCEDGCTYFLVLEDSGGDGWDGASIDVSLREEWPANNYKVNITSCTNSYDVIPLQVKSGEFIDLEYWNGANETEHAWALLDWNKDTILSSGYDAANCNSLAPIPAQPYRAKAECPECCEVEYSDFCARVTVGLWPEFMSWELYEGTCSTTKQGERVFYINATFYEGNPPGSVIDHEIPNLDGCQEYTIALFDGFNTGWNGGDWTLLTTDKNLGGPANQILDETDSKFGWFEVTGVTDAEFPNDNNANLPGDEYRECWQLPCPSDCPGPIVGIGDPVNCTGTAEIITPEAMICYPNCNHAFGIGCEIDVDLEVLVDGNPDPNASIFFDLNLPPGMNVGTIGGFPVGCHKIVYYINYCDGITTRCTSDITISTVTNPTMVCNDLVHISLKNNDDNPAEGGWSQGFNDDLDECVIKITPDMVLEATANELCQNSLNSEYSITLLDSAGNLIEVLSDRGLPMDCFGREIPPELLNCPLVPATNLISSAQVKTTITYVIEHKLSGNKCWGEIKVEDKDAPLIICNDYDVECTNPDYANEDFEVTDTIQVGPELPANIAGGFGGPGQSNLFLPVNIGVDKCYPLGVTLKDIQVNLDMIHNEITDVSVFLHLPTALINAGFTSPMTLDLNGDVGSQNTYTPNPINDSPDLLAFVQGPLANPDCNLLASTSPEYFGTETTGANSLPGNLGGTWYIQVVDNNVSFPDPPFGAGEVTAANIIITCGFPTPMAAYDCSPFEVNLISEIIEETNCDQSDWNGAKLLRTYEAIDECGNASYCTQTVNLKAPSFDDISIPGNIDLECSDATCDPENITPDLSGSPFFGCFDVTADLHSFCDISYTYNDQIIPTCGKGYKIVREWTIVNCCTNVFKNFTQLIGVGDHTGPEINAGDITANSDPYDCDASLAFSQAVTDACSGVSSISVSYTVGGGAYTGGGTVNIANVFPGGDFVDNLPLGVTEVMITATDSCNNSTVQLVNVTIEDNSQPFAVCDDNLHVSLNNDGLAWITAENFDEGSSDNCSEVTLEIRSLGCVGEGWGPAAEVACCDAPNVVLELRVTDAAGNTNICWAEITIEDPFGPIVTCPSDLTVDCNDPLFDNPWQEEPTASDNCAANLINTVDGGSLGNCHAGTLTRTWTYSDGSDKSDDVSCTQRITFEHVSDFTVQFPPDITIDTCPDDTGDTGAPIILDDDCELVAINYEDLELTIQGEACFKIIRKWTLINWCVYDDTQTPTNGGIPLPLPNTFRDNDGYFYYEQTIKVIDQDAPTVDMPTPDPCDYTDGCEGFVELIAIGSDDCSSELQYEWSINAFGEGVTIITGDGEDASGVYPYGCHIITWHVGDHCGNWTSTDFEFCIEDCKNPTPVCLNGISVEVMNDGDGCVPIWATDLLEYAFDNCDGDSTVEASVLIRREGETGPPQTQIEVCCDDVPGGIVNVEIWVTDEAGNSDYCTTYIIPQDNLGNCPGSAGGSAMIAGDVLTESGQVVGQVTMDIAQMSGTMSNTMANNNSGYYAFENLATNNTYCVSPEKDINPLNGVSTYDLVLISQHIIGTNPLTSPYQLIAADVNNSGTISTFDLVQLRQLILFVITDFPSNKSWRFVDSDYVFPIPTNPWSAAFPENVCVTPLMVDELDTDFVGIKVGDINGSANPNNFVEDQSRDYPSTLLLEIEDRKVKAGETYNVAFKANDFTQISGYQFTLEFDASKLELVSTAAGRLKVADGNFGHSYVEEGILTTSYNEAVPMSIETGSDLFYINFKAKEHGYLKDMLQVSSSYTNAEAYTNGGVLIDVDLAFNKVGATLSSAGFELLQNKPNPFNESTVIGFSLPQAATATFKIFDVSGKLLKYVEGDFARGYNEVSFESKDLQATGVLYYQLDTEGFSATKKMILIE